MRVYSDEEEKQEFDCVEMKRRIQEKIYEETKDMTNEELIEYFHKRIANSRFASFLRQSEGRQSIK